MVDQRVMPYLNETNRVCSNLTSCMLCLQMWCSALWSPWLCEIKRYPKLIYFREWASWKDLHAQCCLWTSCIGVHSPCYVWGPCWCLLSMLLSETIDVCDLCCYWGLCWCSSTVLQHMAMLISEVCLRNNVEVNVANRDHDKVHVLYCCQRSCWCLWFLLPPETNNVEIHNSWCCCLFLARKLLLQWY